MAKILTFRNKGTAPSGQDFLTDAAQTLSFRMTEDGAVSLGDLDNSGLPDLFPDPKKDWSNQELADLFRVRQLLSSANVPVETDRGVTDEGDPWFVFCHINGEVFIHLCRIDGAYVLDSPNVLRPLHGADFNGLIADFTNQAIPARGTEDDADRRVIRLERGGKVRLHPSAMLAALIWTLFLASEDLVLLAPDPEASDETLLDFDGLLTINTSDGIDTGLLFENGTLDVAHLMKDGTPESAHSVADVLNGHMREASLQQQQQGLTVQNNAFTMGLSTIAIAMGFMSETVLLDNQRKVLESLKELGFSEYGSDAQQGAEHAALTDTGDGTLLAMLADFLGLELSLETDMADASPADSRESLLQQDAMLLADEVHLEKLSAAAIKAAMTATKKADQDHNIDTASVTPRPAQLDLVLLEAANEDALPAEVTTDTIHTFLSDMIVAWQPTMQSQDIQRGIIDVSFELSGNVDTPALFDLVNTETGELIASFHQSDVLALRLVEFIETKTEGFGVVTVGNAIYMLDRSAARADGGDTDFIQWESADGKTISLIGLTSDFEQFDMIA